MTHSYAQTHIQLFRQLDAAGYPEGDQRAIGKGYSLAARLCSGQYRPSGKPNVDHLIGTASILCSLHQPIEVIAAGLLHSVYTHGDFGTLRRGIADNKRELVRQAVGAPAEAYVARYTSLEWDRSAIAGYLSRLSLLTPFDRTVLLMRLADRLEDTLDGGDLYCANAQQRLGNLEHVGGPMVTLATLLGFPSLAAELNDAFASLRSAPLPEGLQNAGNPTRVYQLVPPSYRVRYPTAIARQILKILSRVGRRLKRSPEWHRD